MPWQGAGTSASASSRIGRGRGQIPGVRVERGGDVGGQDDALLHVEAASGPSIAALVEPIGTITMQHLAARHHEALIGVVAMACDTKGGQRVLRSSHPKTGSPITSLGHRARRDDLDQTTR